MQGVLITNLAGELDAICGLLPPNRLLTDLVTTSFYQNVKIF